MSPCGGRGASLGKAAILQRPVPFEPRQSTLTAAGWRRNIVRGDLRRHSWHLLWADDPGGPDLTVCLCDPGKPHSLASPPHSRCSSLPFGWSPLSPSSTGWAAPGLGFWLQHQTISQSQLELKLPGSAQVWLLPAQACPPCL